MSFISENPYGIRDDLGLPDIAHRVATFRPAWNSPGRNDVTGAFEPEALRFSDCHRFTGLGWRIDNRKPRLERASEFLDFLSKGRVIPNDDVGDFAPLAVVAIFCHGSEHGLPSFGIRSPNHPRFSSDDEANWTFFCAELSMHVAPTVILYACSAAGRGPSGDGALADELRDELCRRGSVHCRVVAHTTAGHATVNPFIRIVDGTGRREPGAGAKMLITPGTRLFGKLAAELRDENDTFRFRYPFMPVAEIIDEVRDDER